MLPPNFRHIFNMLLRPGYLEHLNAAVQRSPITALLGPRQCGKTTLARLFAEHETATFFDLESVVDQRRLQNPQLGFRVAAPAMRRFWTMLAHTHGQTWKASELGRALGQSDKAIRGYLDILSGTYMVRHLQPWFENLGKRQVKAPKVYFRDSGLLHLLLDLPTRHDLLGHPKVGASWEGFAIEQVLRTYQPAQPYFWSTHGGPELDRNCGANPFV